MNFPILEFDDSSDAIINPNRHNDKILPECCVIVFYQKAVEKLYEDKIIEKLDLELSGEVGKLHFYQIVINDKKVVICHPPGLGGPLAAVTLEILISYGVKKVIVCGHGGVLRKELLRNSVMVVSSAIRQEGVSYQYIAPSREIIANEAIVKKVYSELKNHQLEPIIGKTWTMDSMYRETKNTIEKRKNEGALTVEMECASLLAVAEFRKISLCQLVCAGDDVSGKIWDQRFEADKISVREKMTLISAEICATL